MIIPKIVIVHCSDTPDYPIDHPNFDNFGAEQINLWHKQRGWEKIGYHLVIRRTGEIQEGRKIDIIKGMVEKGAHCSGNNFNSIGVCYIGHHLPTNQQLEGFHTIYNLIKTGFNITKEAWFPHNHFNPKKLCPGISIESLKNLF
jgi:hypothetical protein